MPCCGLAGGLDVAGAKLWLGCLSRALGFSAAPSTWDDKRHARLYIRAMEVSADLERLYPDLLNPVQDPKYGINVEKTAQLAGVICSVHDGMRSAFWSCFGVTETEAARQVEAQEGPYWSALVAAAAVIMCTERPGASAATKGPLALVILAAGCAGTILGFEGK